MTLTVKSKDSTFSEVLLQRYLEQLNDDIRATVKKDADENVEYLNKRLETVSDPLLREKFQGLIASEVEKAMLVSNAAFRIVDPVYRTKKFTDRRIFPLVGGIGLFFLAILVAIFGHALMSADKTAADRKLIGKIKSELFHF